MKSAVYPQYINDFFKQRCSCRQVLCCDNFGHYPVTHLHLPCDLTYTSLEGYQVEAVDLGLELKSHFGFTEYCSTDTKAAADDSVIPRRRARRSMRWTG